MTNKDFRDFVQVLIRQNVIERHCKNHNHIQNCEKKVKVSTSAKPQLLYMTTNFSSFSLESLETCVDKSRDIRLSTIQIQIFKEFQILPFYGAGLRRTVAFVALY
jgi:hypothetical protein